MLFPVTFFGMVRFARDFHDAFLDNTTEEYNILKEKTSGIIVRESPFNTFQRQKYIFEFYQAMIMIITIMMMIFFSAKAGSLLT